MVSCHDVTGDLQKYTDRGKCHSLVCSMDTCNGSSLSLAHTGQVARFCFHWSWWQTFCWLLWSQRRCCWNLDCLGTLGCSDALKQFGSFVLLSCLVIIVRTKQGISRPTFILEKMKSGREKKKRERKKNLNNKILSQLRSNKFLALHCLLRTPYDTNVGEQWARAIYRKQFKLWILPHLHSAALH